MSKLDELEALLEKATPGEWRVNDRWNELHNAAQIDSPTCPHVADAPYLGGTAQARANAALIAAMKNALPDLLAAMKNALPDLLKAAREMEEGDWQCKDFSDGWITFPDRKAAEKYQESTGALMRYKREYPAAMREAT